jgi:predicted type IV restriction endonuclease
MDGGQITAVVIVAIVMVASIIRAGMRGSRHPLPFSSDEGTRAENLRLRDEVQDLKERIKVLERITVEKENSLAKEIESLRDR